MRALYTTKPAELCVCDREMPVPAPDEVLVKVKSVAVCHTDLNIKNGTSQAVVYPRVPGHEIAGEVVKCGSLVKYVHVGDFGVLQTIIACGGCPPCRHGFFNNCQNFDELGLKRDGGFAEYCTIPARNFIRMSSQVDPDEACLTEPLANAVSAVRRSDAKVYQSVAVIGPGPIGLMVLALLKKMGMSRIILAGTRDERLEYGKQFGASKVVNIHKCDPVKEIRDYFDGKGADLVFDCSGTISGFELSMQIAARFGKIMMEGLVDPKKKTQFSPGDMPGNSSIINVEGWLPDDFQTAAFLIETKQIEVGKLITHTFGLEDWKAAFDLAELKKDGVIKAILHP